MKFFKTTATILVIGIALLGINYFKNTNKTIPTDIEIKSENTLPEQYKNIDMAIYKNNLDEYIESKNEYIYYNIPLSKEQQEWLQQLCMDNSFSYEIALSIIYTESRYDANVISKTSDYGLFQLKLAYHQYFSDLAGLKEYNVLNYKDNSKMAISYLVYIKNYWIKKGTTDDQILMVYILNSYNAGITGYEKYIAETGTIHRNYDKKVLDYKSKLETDLKIN